MTKLSDGKDISILHCLIDMKDFSQHVACEHTTSELTALRERLERVEKVAEAARTIESQIGWRGNGEKAREGFYCEFCAQYDEDETKIPHTDGCPARLLRQALTEWKEK